MSHSLVVSAAATKAAAPSAGLSFAAVGGMVLALLMVLALILGMAWLLRRLSGVGLQNPSGLQPVASLAVGPKERVMVVQAGETQLVIGVTAHQISLLHRLETPLPAPAAGESFATLLARLRKEGMS